MPEINIRRFDKKDRVFVRQLCCETAFSGLPVENFFEGREIIADLLTMYHTDYEPESVFIAEVDGVRAGYLTGNKNIKRKKRIFNIRILPVVLRKTFFKGILFKRKNLIFLLNCIRSFFRQELFEADFSKQYPATLHINIDFRYRGMGIGEKLIEHYCEHLRKVNVKGIHLSTVSERAAGFFQKNGFIILHRREISYFAHISSENLFRFTLGKKLF